MDVIVKVVIDQKEYDRLIDIERKYTHLASTSSDHIQNSVASHQSGHGNSQFCHCQQTQSPNIPLSQIVAENTEADAVQPPLPGILPSITMRRSPEPPLNIEFNNTKKESKGKKAEKEAGAQEEETFSAIGHRKSVYPWYYIGIPK